MIGADLLRFQETPIIVADAESQRVNTMQANLPFQWAFVKTVKGKVLERHNHYLKWPNYRMSAGAAQITRFQQSWVDNGEDPQAVLEAWEKDALDPNVLLAGHNLLAFDVPLWMLWRRELGLPPIWRQVIPRVLDSHLLARAYKLGLKPDRDNLAAWFYKVYNHRVKDIKTNLTVMGKELGIDFDESRMHDGMYDIEVNVAVLWKLINMVEI